MNCQQFTQFIMDWLDGELPADQAQVFETHIGLCPPCENYLAQYKSTVELARDCVPDEVVPTEIPEELVRAILAAKAAEAGEPVQPPPGDTPED